MMCRQMLTPETRRSLILLVAALWLVVSHALASAPFDGSITVNSSTQVHPAQVASAPAGINLDGAFRCRVAGYNIAHARGVETGGLNELAKTKHLRGIANLLAAQKADIIGLTEISSRDLRAGFRNQPEFIAKHLGFHHVYGENVHKGLFGLLATQGNAVVSRYPIVKWTNHKLYRSDDKHEQRSCVEALLDLGKGRRLRVFVAHLSLKKDESKRQLDEIWGWVQASAEPVVLVGDFNLRPHSDGIKWMSQRMTDTTANLNTTYKNLPDVKIDYHFTHGNVVAGRAIVTGFKEGYSDHGCVINDYWLPK